MEENRNIRISKVLKEFNISLDRVVDTFKEKGIIIEHSPNAKLNEKEYKILRNIFVKYEKPLLIKKLEEQLGITLNESIELELLGWDYSKTYSVNSKDQIIGLNLCLNIVEDISFLNNFPELLYLDLSSNKIKDFLPIKSLTNLAKISLDSTNVKDLKFLIGLKSLIHLSIARNEFVDFTQISRLNKLEYLCLQDNKLSRLNFTLNFRYLKYLDLSFNELKIFQITRFIQNIETLLLDSNEIKNFTFLSGLKKLKRISLGANQISNISFLRSLKIHALNLGENPIKNYSVLKTLPYLKELSISHSNLTDVSFLKHLKSLEYLHLRENKIEKIHFFENLDKLKFIDVSLNKIDEINEFKFISKNPTLKIRANNNPCFDNYNVIFEKNYNQYLTIVNELGKRIEDEQVVGFFPEKIILLGNHSSGKSSLRHYLQNENLDFKEDSTHILKIENYPENYEKLPSAIIYDFGGQDFYHGIYNTFLTKNSITLLLWNSNTNFNSIKEDKDGKLNINYNVNYWLGQREVNSHVGDLIIIQTHSDKLDNKRISYINDFNANEEFYISLERESKESIKENRKHKILKLLKYTLDEIIYLKQIKNTKEDNLVGEISINSFNLLRFIIDSEETHVPIEKESLKKYYPTNENRFNSEIEQLHLQGLILIHNNYVWLKPMALAKFFHEKILGKGLVGKGIIEKGDFELTIDEPVIKLLLDKRVIFLDNNERYIIPNYLPLTTEDDKIFELLTFDHNEPNFILKFKNFIPFGFINQLICFYGRNGEIKYYWRDQLIFKTNNNRFRVLIKLDYSNLEISVSIKSIESNGDVSKIEKEIFLTIIDLFWDEEPLYNELEDKINEDINIENLVEGKLTVKIIHEDKKINSPKDMYLSVDAKTFINHRVLEDENKTKLKINSYTLTNERDLDLSNVVEQSSGIYKNFTNNKQIKEMKKIFISYSRKDVDYKNELKKHLNILETFSVADNWSCEEITIGKWESQIQKELEESDLIIYMLSANFFSSKYILEKEVKRGMDLINQSKEKNILCVIVSEFVGLDKLKSTLENNSKTELQDSLLNLSNYQYLPYDKIKNLVNNNDEEKIITLKEHSNNNTIEKALTQITEKILEEISK